MSKPKILGTDTFTDLITKTNQISTNVGDLILLNTIQDSDIVGSINELKSNIDSNWANKGIDLTQLSVVDSGGDGYLSYDNTTGVFHFKGPVDSDVWSHFSSGSGILISSGTISLQDSGITSAKFVNGAVGKNQLADSSISSNHFYQSTSLTIYDSAGVALKTIYGSGV